MKKWGKYLFVVLFILLALTGVTSIGLISSISSYSTLINYVGIVRGASQRLVKLELCGDPDDGLLQYVDEILSELQVGHGKYGLEHPGDRDYNKCLGELAEQWDVVKGQIEAVRRGGDPVQLLGDSEELFVTANDTVFAIENYSRNRSDILIKTLFGNLVGSMVAGICVIYSVIHEYFALKRHSDELAYRADRDSLTGAYLYDRFLEKAQEELDKKDGAGIAFQRLDFENFRYINDVFGYSYGDSILRRYTQCLGETLREGEFMGRIVADQFLVLRRYKEKEELAALQKQAEQAFFAAERLLPEQYAITVASGFCCLEDVIEDLDAKALIDRATYAQKTVKGNPDEHCAFYNEAIREKLIKENQIKKQSKAALEKHEFVVYFQPKVSPGNGTVHGAEALVRWRLPDGSVLPPGQFVPVLERSHMVRELDQYVFEETCRMLGERIRAGKPIVPISVNVSKLRLYTLDFVETYSRIKREYQIPDGYLELEFTETVAFKNLGYMAQVVKGLHENGFRCSMDDFGKGYSSMGMLKSLPFDTVKLDASFFDDGGDGEKHQVIIMSVMNLIHQLHMDVVAEGIEQRAQVEFLKSVGCDLIQGYYYYRPMPEEEFTRLLSPEPDMGQKPEGRLFGEVALAELSAPAQAVALP